MQGKLAAFAHEAAQYCTIWQPYFGSAASEPGFTSGDTWSQVIAAQGSLGGRGSTLQDPSACSWDENPFCNPKKTRSRLHLLLIWPIELRFQRKTAALAALQDPHHSIVQRCVLRTAVKRFNCSQCKHSRCAARGAVTTPHWCPVTTPHCCASNPARCCASPSPRRCCRPAAASPPRRNRAARSQ